LISYGIPDFKLEKWVLDRRLDLMQHEGIPFEAGIDVGVDVTPQDLDLFDALVICTGATVPRDLPVPGRDLD
jgi:glutamate synthase (NADPH/NADH) small chain